MYWSPHCTGQRHLLQIENVYQVKRLTNEHSETDTSISIEPILEIEPLLEVTLNVALENVQECHGVLPSGVYDRGGNFTRTLPITLFLV